MRWAFFRLLKAETAKHVLTCQAPERSLAHPGYGRDHGGGFLLLATSIAMLFLLYYSDSYLATNNPFFWLIFSALFPCLPGLALSAGMVRFGPTCFSL